MNDAQLVALIAGRLVATGKYSIMDAVNCASELVRVAGEAVPYRRGGTGPR